MLRRTPNSTRTRAFSLPELMFVIGIMVLVAAFIAPAFTSLKSAGDVTSVAYTIKGVLDQARTSAMANNNTYTWVGFAGSVGSNTTAVTGQVSIAVVAPNDETKFVKERAASGHATTVYSASIDVVNMVIVELYRIAQLLL